MTIEQLVSQVFTQVIIFLLGLLPITILYLRNRSNQERNKIAAQEIINERFKKVSDDLDLTRSELNEIKVSFAEERGGLNQRIKSLEEQLNTERTNAENRSRENYGQISSLQAQLSDLRVIQGQLQSDAKRISDERDSILETMRKNNQELGRLQKQVGDLTRRNHELERQLQEKDRQLEEIRKKLDGEEQ